MGRIFTAECTENTEEGKRVNFFRALVLSAATF